MEYTMNLYMTQPETREFSGVWIENFISQNEYMGTM